MQLCLLSHARRKLLPPSSRFIQIVPFGRPITSPLFTHRYHLPRNNFYGPKPSLITFSTSSPSATRNLDNSATDPTVCQNNVSDPQSPEEAEVILYRRDITNPDAMHTTTLMRSGFFFASFHTLYWIWYTLDFLPAVNASPMIVLHVDPMIGVAGIGFALSLQSAFMLYPLRLIYKLTYRPDEQRICVHTHRLPLMHPSVIKPNASFPVGPLKVTPPPSLVDDNSASGSPKEDMESLKAKSKQIADANARASKKLRYFTLDPTSPVALSLIQGESQGDISKYRGHIMVGPSWPRYVLDIKAAEEVKEPALLLKILLHPETFQYKMRKEVERKSSSVRFKIRPRKAVPPSKKSKRRR